MGDVMRPVPFRDLMVRMVRELELSESIFGFYIHQFHRPRTDRSLPVCSQDCAVPVGPAAGPHTQLAQNIIVSYLAGGRFMELKTVQVLDELKIEKPCIDAADEGYNVEWSSEFTLEKSFDEYLKAWFALHVLEVWLGLGIVGKPSFIFNMSVGYDLEGIKTEKMQRFIDSMSDASSHEKFLHYKKELAELINEEQLWDEDTSRQLLSQIELVSPRLSPSVTLSTMHGCPPEEIEAICRYMLEEKQIDTFVKLNPTLLGYDRVREILDTLEYDYLHLSREAFSKDLQYHDAVEMIRRLTSLACVEGRGFGIKLSNTLGSINDQGRLPGDEMYMSGRALYPLTITLAAQLAREFSGEIPISYSGGAAADNIADLFDAGVRPITAATELLKPSGYMRLTNMVAACEASISGWRASRVDWNALERLADLSLSLPRYRKSWRGEDGITTGEPLPRYDCYIAPCVAACPIKQDIPEYIYLTGQGLYDEALEVIYQKNPLPHIMGYICDHQCMYNCTRMDYEGAVQIRELKRIAAEQGFARYKAAWQVPEKSDVKAAVIGSGPAGLSAAYFLAQSGFDVTVLEREDSPGGIVQHVIPPFRFPQSAIDQDVAFIREHGVHFEFGVDPSRLAIEDLRHLGFSYIIYALGAELNKKLTLDPAEGHILDSLTFLRDFRKGKSRQIGSHVVVVGGGNTAMDSARAAAAVKGVDQVTVVYRRTKKQMPADLEEYDQALADGVEFRFLTNPVSLQDGQLVCRVMELGEPDESGRPRPVETGETVTLNCSALITAVGETVDARMLGSYGLPMDDQMQISVDPKTQRSKLDGVYVIGDAESGPSTVVRCAASARRAYEDILDHLLGPDEEHHHDHEEPKPDSEELEDLREGEEQFFAELREKGYTPVAPAERGDMDDDHLAAHEASRCLECSYLCNRCVDVCPNRANIALDVRSLGFFEDPFQIIHLDAFCNECGNCAVFCPWEGEPYRDKLTLFSLRRDYESSDHDGFLLEGDELTLRVDRKEYRCRTDELIQSSLPESERLIISQVIHAYPYLLVPVED